MASYLGGVSAQDTNMLAPAFALTEHDEAQAYLQ